VEEFKMTVKEKAAYVKGLIEGLDLDADKKRNESDISNS